MPRHIGAGGGVIAASVGTGRARGQRRVGWAVLVGVVLASALVGCSGDDGGSTDSAEEPDEESTTTVADRPEGPAADLTEELTGGDGPFVAAADPAGNADEYIEEEYVASGTAAAYEASEPLTGDGQWSFEESDDTAPYRTRVLVRRPASAEAFSGVVVVEWFNVSAGIDANPDYASLEEELVRQGHAWVGVSAQLIGVEGGPVLVSAPGAEDLAGEGLKAIDPERYGSLEHPGDGFAFDIYTQVARALRADGPALGDLEPEVVLAAGESQSAIALVTYHNGVQPLTRAFDGFFVHSRAGVGLPLVGPGEYADLASGLATEPTILRTDLDVPALVLQAEGDVTSILSSLDARQDDTDGFRLWEVAGTAHADAHLVGSTADALDCGVAINDGPLHLVAKAGLRALVDWVRTDTPPPEAPRLEVTEEGEIRRDADGIAEGGIRTPPVDVPVAVLSGEPGPSDDVICLLLGSTTPLPADRLAALYPDRATYEARYEAESAETIDAGFVLEEDRDALLAYADPARVAG